MGIGRAIAVIVGIVIFIALFVGACGDDIGDAFDGDDNGGTNNAQLEDRIADLERELEEEKADNNADGSNDPVVTCRNDERAPLSKCGPGNAPNGGTSTSSGGGSATQVNNSDPVQCISTTEMNELTGSDVQRVGGEACAYTLRVAAIGATGVKCPAVLICTLTIGEGTQVYRGDDSASYNGVIAGTVRLVNAYPQGDAVYTPCRLTANEHAFGQQQNPRFDVTPGNFSC